MLLSPGTRGDAHRRSRPACAQAPVRRAAAGAQVQRGPHAAGLGAQPGPCGAAGTALARLLLPKSPSCRRSALTRSASVAGRAGVLQAAAQFAGEQAAGRRGAGAAAVPCTVLICPACHHGPVCSSAAGCGRACAAWCPPCSAAATCTRRSAWCALAPGSCTSQRRASLPAFVDTWAHAQACQQRSEGSRRVTHFYELDVQVKGMATLERSLVRLPACR